MLTQPLTVFKRDSTPAGIQSPLPMPVRKHDSTPAGMQSPLPLALHAGGKPIRPKGETR